MWSTEPDVATIKKLAKRHLLALIPSDFDDTLFDVQFFAQGTFNKLYRVSYETHPMTYMFRVSLPLDPFFKVESEVATLAFVRAKTLIPVARVIAWDSNWDTDLGFEWILTEMIQGVPLWDVWRQVSWERKIALTEEIARMIAQLRSQRLNAIGSLYFKSTLHPRAGEPDGTSHGQDAGRKNVEPTGSATAILPIRSLTDESTAGYEKALRFSTAASRDQPEDRSDIKVQDGGKTVADPIISGELDYEKVSPRNTKSDGDLTVGHMLRDDFLFESRIDLPANRGPFQSSLEWMRATVAIQLQWIDKGLSVLCSKQDFQDTEFDSDMKDEAPEMKELCHKMLGVLPEIFNEEEDDGGFVLHHHDLNQANILVHPETFDITGILDWEMACVVPEWTATRAPKFLDYIVFDWESEEPPHPPSYDEEKHQFAIEARDRWDYKQLRQHFDTALKRALLECGHAPIADSSMIETKQEVMRKIHDIAGNWEWTRRWLKKYHNGGVDPQSDSSSEDGSSDEAAEAIL